MTTDTNQSAACCAQFYELDWVQTILGDSFHPGGTELSCRLLNSLSINPGDTLLDVACGIGTTAMLAVEEYKADVTGVDFSKTNIESAQTHTDQERQKINFVAGNATSLPIESESIDCLICECAVSTFDDQSAAVNEFYRVLKKGGRVAISDMIINGQLPQQLQKVAAPWTCLSEARDVDGYQKLFIEAGFSESNYHDESQSLHELLLSLKKKLLIAGVSKTLATSEGTPEVLASLNVADLTSLLAQAKQCVNEGTVQYGRMTFSKNPC